MNTQQSNPHLEHSTRTCLESTPDQDRLQWISYLTSTHLESNLSHSDRIRLSLTEYFHNLKYDQNRTLFHLTTTYKPYQDRIYTQKDIDVFYKKFYVQYLLPTLLKTKNIHTQSKKSIQPITFTFTDEHHQSFDFDRLHHHSILSVHPDNVDFFHSLPETNPFPNTLEFTKKICTSHIRECEPMCLLYSSKMLNRYPDYMTFPDTFKRNRRSH